MSNAGRPSKPTNLKILQGNPGGRPLNENEPVPVTEEDVPKPPSYLSTHAKNEWKRIVPEMQRLGIFTAIDHPSLAGYCQAYGRFIEAEKILKKEGLTFKSPNGYVQQRPEVSISNNALKTMREFASQFGLTPSARSRIDTSAGENKEDEFLNFLQRRDS
ncbi:phage terminase small subunit P27 family [Oceanobacillus oncorhynchi]|uniref:phage terminase small subunit P27 family n=1 Tax=Oceanobacillus oncorhynchi TaxID=545501 RepID=UPI0018667C29|nr:phage terminase small subunit P27 family [Oceanobacillus oncorhynchi]